MNLPLDAYYFAAAAAAFFITFALTPLVRVAGRRLGFMDAVNPAKIHTAPMVRCGGAAIFLSFMITLALALAAHFSAPAAFAPPGTAAHLANIPAMGPRIAALLGGATLLFLTGLADDRFNLRPLTKLALQIVSALPLVAVGITIKCFIPGVLPSALLTIAWVVLLTNAFNFLDNMNGLTSGVAVVCALNFFLVSRLGGEFFMMAMFAVLLGAIAGFIPWNFPRARLFMGDSGSLFIGYMLAALSILVTYYREGVPTQLPVVAPLVILGVPLFDSASVMFIRWRRGLPLMKGDQNHFSHRLVALGFSRPGAVLFIHLVTLTVGLSAVNLPRLGWAGAAIALLQVMLFFLLIFVLESVGKRRMENAAREAR